MKSEIVDRPTVTLWLEDGILHYIIKEGVRETAEDARDGFDESMRLIGEGNTTVVLADLTRMKSMSREARDFRAKGPPSQVARALALVVRSAISRVIGNFFLGINRPSYPVRLFNDVDAAVTWLRGYVAPE